MVSSSQDYLEHVTTPLHACSLESPPEPLQTKHGSFWPLLLGCYQLQDDTRRGKLDLFSVRVPEDNDSPVTLGVSKTVYEDSGILDGKWSLKGDEILYATAHAAGDIQIHHLVENDSQEMPFDLLQVGKSQPQDSLCLALAWNLPSMGSTSRKLISSYSDGHVAIHTVHTRTTSASTNVTANLELVESWSAHKMFQNPAEVWAACFTTHEDVVLTGGDEGYLKIWDIRAGTSRPVQTLSKTFEAGVTVLSPHPRTDHLIACGSYDETMAVMDLRLVSSSQPPHMICQSDPLGGGLWRLKWHPHDNSRLLVAAMHGGCRIVDIGEKVHVHQDFTHHQSMAYGADWLVYQSPRCTVQAAVSCSFYDQAMYLWNVNP